MKKNSYASKQNIESLYATDPISWNIHAGPRRDDIRSRISNAAFRKRAGQKLISLTEERLSGKLGQRKAILKELEIQFKIVEINELHSYEACEIEGSLGPD